MIQPSDVSIIGAGPAGAVAAALLARRGLSVAVFERGHFPRFSIGESLLPQCMEFIEEAGMMAAAKTAGFQYKNGACFARRGRTTAFDFREKFSPGPGETWQVQRANFDQVLANDAERQGAKFYYGHGVSAFSSEGSGEQLRTRLEVSNDQGESYSHESRFVLDASGFGRVMPRLLDLETPSEMPVRSSCFTHVQDNISSDGHDRDKILIAVHPEHDDIWYWLIPFSNGRCSVGAVAPEEKMAACGETPEQILKHLINAMPELAELLANAEFDTPVNRISGYACNVKSLHGPGFALLGNAGEFLDPIFSSGVTIAMKSASLAAPLVAKQVAGEPVDWETEFSVPLRRGVDTFKTYVNAWYRGDFQTVVFAEYQAENIREMISSILAGYAWDTNNPYVAQAERRLAALTELCNAQ